MNDLVARQKLTTGAKVFLAFAVFFSAVYLADFVFYENLVTDLLIAIGFALVSYGTYKNGLRSGVKVNPNDPALDKGGQYASAIGTVLALGALLASHVL